MSDVTKVTLGGQVFDIPQLPIGVQRKLSPVLRRMAQRAGKAKAEGSSEAMQEAMAADDNIEDAEMSVAIALAFINKDFSPRKFDEMIVAAKDQIFLMNTDIGEIIEGSMVVAIQAGGKRLGEKMAAMKKAMETPPATEPQTEALPISTPSSPTSA